jgi:formylglycine-generating enzyme required for sulfatase activity/dienelactone hydrolase
VAAGVVALVAGGGWAVRHFSRVQWARAQALPQIRTLADSFDIEGAYRLALRVERVVPDDTILAALWPRFSRVITIASEPAGARVLRRAFAGADTAWVPLGVTPLDSVRVPNIGSYLRLEKDGFQPLEALVSGGGPDWRFTLDSGRGPDAGMVVVPGGHMQELNLPGLEGLGNVDVGTFLVDVHEVTNRQFKTFVDSGGYRRREFWDQPFVLDGRPLAWDAAVARFTDRTGRPGPATWEAGDFPAGQADHPVSGVSWYEAMAYARFRGKSLPTIFHWVRAARTTSAAFIVPRSNLEGTGPAPVGAFRGVGPHGTVDMAGNVREWCANDAGGPRYILGGGWNDPGYAFNDAYTQPPFDRSPTNGIRLVRYQGGDSTLAALQRSALRVSRDYARERPVADGIYQVYRRMFDYDPLPLDATIEETDSTSEEYIRERVSYTAAYGGERITAHLYRPRHGTPPYQTVVFFPGSNALNLRAFDPVTNARNFDFMLKSGRAVLFPVYKSTFERGDGFETDIAEMSSAYRDHVIWWVKDFRRSVDYLATRADVDTSRLGYYGISWGGVTGGIIPAVEPRIKVVMLYVAGLLVQRSQPEVDAFNHLPRITQPVLMLNGRYDHYFPVESSQMPFFRTLGTPAAHKRQVIAEGGHFVPRNEIIAETLAWLDRYLGPAR